MLKFSLSAFFCLLCTINTYQALGQAKILFDASKGEMAGNADWVIDYDVANVGVGSTGAYTVTATNRQSNAQRIPTPAQSGITASTPETYWSGGISAWGVDCAKRGYIVESLPWNGAISYGNASNAQDLSRYDVFIIDEPNLAMSASEKAAIINFVSNGGSLFIVADHEGSDRNGDGWDSRMVLNDLIRNNGVDAYPFGFIYDSVDFSQTTTNISASSTDSLIHGPMGNVTKVQWAGGTTMTLDPSANSTVKGVVYKTGGGTGNANAMVAYARYGRGKVVSMGDSSPTDDGTGNPNCTLYPGYFGDASGNHQLLIMNATIWLTSTYRLGLGDAKTNETSLEVFPNPSDGVITVQLQNNNTDMHIQVLDMAGRSVAEAVQAAGTNSWEFDLTPGVYLVRAIGDNMTYTTKVVITR